jgi:antitoxin CptB|tara:strand:+ start:219 stop:482 length:264 start_codon:yes stop_codon:yes gene_type:complete
MINITNLKKKIIYRSNYRGTKEMDKLLGSFTKRYINIIKKEELQYLCNLLDYDDENLYKYNQGQKTTIKIDTNNVTELFKNYIYVSE